LVVSDEVGQIYVFGTGPEMSQKDVKYDQFFLGDFRPLVRDAFGNVLDVETQLAPHVRNIQDLLCDASMRFSPPQSTWVQPFAFERKKKTVV
jgi:PH-interacting protein